MSAAVKTTPCKASTRVATAESTTDWSASVVGWPANRRTAPKTRVAIVAPAIEPRTTIEAWTPVIASGAIKPVEPRSRANKETVDEPIRPIVAVGRARVGVIAVVAVGANRRRSYVDRANSDSETEHHGLRMGGRSCHQANTK